MPVYPGAHNEHRPHRALEQRAPLAKPPPTSERAGRACSAPWPARRLAARIRGGRV